MNLDSIDWRTITPAQARKLIGPANRREIALGKRFNSGEIEESQWWSAYMLWENLRVFALCGERPAANGAALGTCDED